MGSLSSDLGNLQNEVIGTGAARDGGAGLPELLRQYFRAVEVSLVRFDDQLMLSAATADRCVAQQGP